MDWVQILTTSGAVGALGIALATYLKTRPAMKAAQVQGEAALWVQIEKLKDEAKAEQAECKQRIAGLEALVADLQHDLANETSSLEAFLLLAEANPASVMQQIPRIREMRRHHKERMAMKRGVREGTAIGTLGAGE